jgi:SAM-dependent methyltransferase
MSLQSPDPARARATQRNNWTIAAPGWVERRDEMSSTMRIVTEHILAAARIGAGQRVLDLASGVGDPAFSIAALVGPSGSVLGLDITAAMIEGAAAYAHDHNVTNVEFRVIPSELDLGVAAGEFDAATCRFGLMFMADPTAAMRALTAALKPGGRVAVSTWGPPERVPFMTLPNQIIARYGPPSAPDPDGRSPFTIPTPEALTAVLSGAGLTDVQVEVIEAIAVTAPTPEAYWTSAMAALGFLARALAGLSDAEREAVRVETIAAVRERFPEGPVAMGGEVLIGSGVKPV